MKIFCGKSLKLYLSAALLAWCAIIATMEQPFTLHELQKSCSNPVIITGADPAHRWQINRETAFQSAMIAHQAECCPDASTFFVPLGLSSKTIGDFFSLLVAQKTAASCEQFSDQLRSHSLEQLAEIIEVADELDCATTLDTAIKVYTKKCNEAAIKTGCLKTGAYPHAFHEKLTGLIAAAQLAHDPSTVWFWLTKDQEARGQENPSPGIKLESSAPCYHFTFLGNKGVDSSGKVYDTKKVIAQINTVVNNGSTGDHLLCYKGYSEPYHHTLEIVNSSLQVIHTIPVNMLKSVKATALSRSGKLLAVCDASAPCVYLIDTTTQSVEDLVQCGKCNWLNFNNDESLLLAVMPALRSVHVTNLKNKKNWHRSVQQKYSAKDDAPRLTFAEFSPDSKYIMGIDDKINIWDFQSNYLERTIITPRAAGQLLHARYNATGDLIASTHPSCIYIWDAHTGQLLTKCENRALQYPGQEPISAPAIFSPSGQQLVYCLQGMPPLIIFHKLYNPELEKQFKKDLLPEQVPLLAFLCEKIQENEQLSFHNKKMPGIDFKEFPGAKMLIQSLPPAIKTIVLPHLTAGQRKEV